MLHRYLVLLLNLTEQLDSCKRNSCPAHSMKYFLLLLVFCSGVALPAAQAQQKQVSAATQPMYGVARIWMIGAYCQLSLSDGVKPASEYDYVQENGKARRFADEAAALNYLYSLGWEVLPNGVHDNRYRYLLKRRNP